MAAVAFGVGGDGVSAGCEGGQEEDCGEGAECVAALSGCEREEG